MALATAGEIGAKPGSSIPVGRLEVGIIWFSTCGISFILTTRQLSKLVSCAILSRSATAPKRPGGQANADAAFQLGGDLIRRYGNAAIDPFPFEKRAQR